MQKTLLSLILMLAVFAFVAMSIKALQTRAVTPASPPAVASPGS